MAGLLDNLSAAQQIETIYVAYFGRAADGGGYLYWEGRSAAGMSITAIANSFSVQPEAKANYAFLANPPATLNPNDPVQQASVDTFINEVYQNLFNRQADTVGLAYWQKQILTGAVSIGTAVYAIANGAQAGSADATAELSKIGAAQSFTQLTFADNVGATAPLSASFISHAEAAVAPVHDAASEQASIAASQAYVSAPYTIADTAGGTATATPPTATSGGHIAEGSSITYTISAPANVVDGTVVNDTLTGTGAALSQIATPAAGTVTIHNGVATLIVNTVANVLGGPSPTLTLTLTDPVTGAPLATDTISINEAQQAVTPSAPTVTEGGTVNFAVSTTGVSGGLVVTSPESYTVTGTGLAQVPIADRSGTVSLDQNGQAVVTVHTHATVFNSTTAPTFTLNLFNSGGQVSSAPVSIAESAVLSSLDNVGGALTSGTSGTTVTETTAGGSLATGQSVTFSVSTTGVSGAAVAGTTETWSLSGSAAALADVVGPTSGTVTLDANGHAAVTVLTNFSTSASGSLTFSLSGLPAGAVTDTVNLVANTSVPIILTTGTDVVTGSPAGGTQIIGTQATLGQNDVINGGSDAGAPSELFLTTQGRSANLTSFTVHQVQVFDVGANLVSGSPTTIDMSHFDVGGNGLPGLQTFIDDNSLSSIVLNNVGGNAAGNLIPTVEILNTSDNGGNPPNPVNLTINYNAAVVSGNNNTQNVVLDPVLSPTTGLPNTTLTENGVENFSIASQGGSTNGLVQLVSNTLTDVTFTATASDANFVLLGEGGDGSALPGMAFTTAGANSPALKLADWTGTFYDIGNNGSPAITATGGLTVTGGSGGMNSQFTPNVTGGTTLTGGGIAVAGALTINLGNGSRASFLGQQVSSTGGSITIQGSNAATAAGFLNNGSQATTIATGGGSVSIQGFTGGLGGAGATITTNGSSLVPPAEVGTGGSVSIGTTAAVTGGITENITTAGATHGGVVTVALSANTNSLVFSTGDAHAAIQITGGTNTLDFSGTGTSGFHGVTAHDNSPDTVTATGGTNTLLLDANLLGGRASGVQTINFNTGNMSTAAPINMALLDQTGIVQTINVNDTIGAAPGLSNMTSGDTLNMNSAGTYTLNTGFTTGSATLNLRVADGSDVTVENTLPGSLGTLNFTANGALTTLNLSHDFGLHTLGLFGTADLNVNAVAPNSDTIMAVNAGTDDANLNLAGLAPDLSTVGGDIHLGNGSDTVVISNVIGGQDGSWNIFISNDSFATNSITVTPQYGDTDNIYGSGNANDTINVNGVGGTVHIDTTANVGPDGGTGSDLVVFDQSAVNLTDNDSIYLGGHYNTVQLINGAVNLNDSIFLNWQGVNQLTLAAGFNNSLLLGALAAAQAATLASGDVFTIETGGSVAGVGSTTIIGGPGYASNTPLAVNVASGGDVGGDSIQFNNNANGALTVNATVTDYDTSFESAATTAQGANEGIFANAIRANTLNLTADNNLATIDALGSATAGLQHVQTINGVFGGYTVGMSVVLENNHAATAGTLNLSDVYGTTVVWGQNVTNGTGLTITGGGYYWGTDTLVGGNGGDTIVANSYRGGMSNFILGGGGADILTGVAGSNATGTDFVFSSFANLLAINTITNFHPATDAFYVPAASVIAANVAIPGHLATNGDIVYRGAIAANGNLSVLSTLLHTPVAGGAIQEVYDTGTGRMYVDIANTAVFNADTVSYSMSFGSPSPAAGGITYQTKAQFNALAGTSGLYDNGSSIVPDLQLNGGDITIPIWNFFNLQGAINAGGGAAFAIFDGPGGSLTANTGVTSYNFSALTSGVTFTTPAYNGGTPMGAGTVTGSSYGDSFFVNSVDLTNGFVIHGGSGANQITIDPVGPLTITLSGTSSGAGVGEVTGVQTLNLVDTAGNTISFDPGTAFADINGSTGPDVINTANMVGGGLLNLTQGGGDTVNLGPGSVADGSSPATIQFGTGSAENYVNSSVGGVINTIIIGGGHTTLSLINNDDISQATVSGIDTLNIADNASITLTGAEWNGVAAITVGGGYGSATVTFTGNETVTSAAHLDAGSTYNLGGTVGDTNVLTLQANEFFGAFSGTINGSAANDTVVVGGLSLDDSTHIDLKGGSNFISVSDGADLNHHASIIDTGGTTGLEITGSGSATVTMGNAEYNLFEAAGPINIGSTSGDTIHFDDSDGPSAFTVLDANIQNWVLHSGTNSYTLGAGNQSVTGSSGTDSVDVGTLTLTSASHINLGVNPSGSPNVIGVGDGADLSAATITDTGTPFHHETILHFDDASGDSVTMTSGQEALFDKGGQMTGGGTNTTINITDNASTVVLGLHENNVVTTVNLQSSNTTINLSVGGSATTASTGWDGASGGNTLDVGSGTVNQLINIDNGHSAPIAATNDITHYAVINNFTPGVLTAVDTLHLVLGGNAQSWSQLIVTPGQTTSAAGGGNAIIDISASVGELSSATVGQSGVDTLVNHALNGVATLTAGNEYTFIMSSPTGAAIYEAHAASSSTVDGVQLIGVLNGLASDQLVFHNFV